MSQVELEIRAEAIRIQGNAAVSPWRYGKMIGGGNITVTVVSPIPNISRDDVGGQSCEGDTDKVDMCLAQRRSRRQNRKLPLRFRDVLPQPPPTVPPQIRDILPESIGSVVSTEDCPASPVHSVFRTCLNIFGLVRQYFSSNPPLHDPEEYVTLADLSTIPGAPQVDDPPPEPLPSSSDFPYHPYPNYSSFQLGDWYWNQGVQKSQRDYGKLMEILGCSSFVPRDVSTTHWKSINTKLGVNEYDEGDGEEWEDEDAGWKRTPVSIQVPVPVPLKIQVLASTRLPICIIGLL
jgi:hypothetical protein